MRRRQFIYLISAAAMASPCVARAQLSSRIPKVGFIFPGPQSVAVSRAEAILSGLRVTGYAAPAQVELVVRAADGDPTRIAPLIEEIIAKDVDVFVANGPPVLHASRAVMRTVPIVAIDLETDPVAIGVAASLARPGGNVTGVFLDFPEFTKKWLELLVESNPRLARITVLWDPVTGGIQIEAVRQAATTLNIQLDVLEVRRPSDFPIAFSKASERDTGAMVILSAPLVGANISVLAELAVKHRLSAITLFPDFARAGGLMAYGPNLLGLYRSIGVMCGRVLQGKKAADLPIERPTKFELVLNLRTASHLGLSIPPGLLLRADEVIE